jgi:hypothetical protein
MKWSKKVPKEQVCRSFDTTSIFENKYLQNKYLPRSKFKKNPTTLPKHCELVVLSKLGSKWIIGSSTVSVYGGSL